jgi:hypothetical protein
VFTAEYELDLGILDEMKEMAKNRPIVYFDSVVREKLRFGDDEREQKS